MSSSAEYKEIKLDFQRLISECQDIRREKDAGLEAHRLKITTELRTMRKERQQFNDEWEKKVRDARLYGIEGKAASKLVKEESDKTFYDSETEVYEASSSYVDLCNEIKQSIQVSYCMRDMMRIDSMQKIKTIHKRNGTLSQIDPNLLNNPNLFINKE